MQSEEPARIARLHHDKHGHPVPWFVAWVDGTPDFRIIKPGAIGIAVAAKCCWVCGGLFMRQERRCFVIGPMCAVNHNSAEPPSHYECAAYSATHCPFLTTPNMQRRERHIPAGTVDPPGEFITRNPGVALVWVTRYNKWHAHPAQGGLLFDIGDPDWVEWYARGRPATREEILAAFESGIGALHEAAHSDPRDPRAACEQLDRQYTAALQLVPS